MSSLNEPASLLLAREKLRRVAANRQADSVGAQLRGYAADPLRYAREVLGVRWWSKQEEVAKSVRDNPHTLVRAGHGVGKTHVAGGIVNWFFDSHPQSIIQTTAPKMQQVKDLLWKEIRVQRRRPPRPDQTQLKDPNDPAHFAVGITTGKQTSRDEFGAQAFQGQHAEDLLVVMDEAAGVDPIVWDAIEGVVVGSHNRILAIGNPVQTSGPYYDAALSGKWNVIEISVLEHPNIAAGLRGEPDPFPGAVSLRWLQDHLDDPYWVTQLHTPFDDVEREHWRTEGAFEFPPGSDEWYMPSPVAEVKILGRFPSQAMNAVWSMAWLDAARNRSLAWEAHHPLGVGLDVARFGDDSTSLHIRRGPVSLLHQSWSKLDVTVTAYRVLDEIKSILAKFEPEDRPPLTKIKLDVTGAPGVAETLRLVLSHDANIHIVEVHSSERPVRTDLFHNTRSELWFAARDRGRTGELDLTLIDERMMDVLAAQLVAPRYEYDPSDKYIVESKDKTKKRIGRSPDDADAFNLAYYEMEGSGVTADFGVEHHRWHAVLGGKRAIQSGDAPVVDQSWTV